MRAQFTDEELVGGGYPVCANITPARQIDPGVCSLVPDKPDADAPPLGRELVWPVPRFAGSERSMGVQMPLTSAHLVLVGAMRGLLVRSHCWQPLATQPWPRSDGVAQLDQGCLAAYPLGPFAERRYTALR